MKKKVLISVDYGAGWSSWASDEHAKVIAEYQPIIEYVESGAPIESGEASKYAFDFKATWDERYAWLHPDFRALIKRMVKDLGLDELDDFYAGGAGDGLKVVTVDGPYRIDEYDGAERVTTAADLWE